MDVSTLHALFLHATYIVSNRKLTFRASLSFLDVDPLNESIVAAQDAKDFLHPLIKAFTLNFN
jgi:hypothetical protein